MIPFPPTYPLKNDRCRAVGSSEGRAAPWGWPGQRQERLTWRPDELFPKAAVPIPFKTASGDSAGNTGTRRYAGQSHEGCLIGE